MPGSNGSYRLTCIYEVAKLLSKEWYPFTCPPAVYESPSCSTSLLTLGLVPQILAVLSGITLTFNSHLYNDRWYWVSFSKDFIYFFFREGKGGRKREKKINVWLPLTHPLLGTWPVTQACARTGNWTGHPLLHSLALHPLSYTSHGLSIFS